MAGTGLLGAVGMCLLPGPALWTCLAVTSSAAARLVPATAC